MLGFRRRALDAATRPAGELTGGRRRAVDNRGHLIEWHREDVVQHERHPLGGRQLVEDDQHRHPDRIAQEGLLLRVQVAGIADHRLRQVGLQRVLRVLAARTEPIQADARDDGGQPAAQVGNVVRIGPAVAQPGVLHGVIGLTGGSQHPIGDGPQMGPMLLELLPGPVLAHLVTFPGFRGSTV